MTRVLVVNHAVEEGGAELTLLDLLAQRPPGVDVTLAVPAEGPLAKRARALGVPVELAGPGGAVLAMRRTQLQANPLRAARAVAALVPALAKLVVLARRADVVLTNSTKAHLYGSLAARLARRHAVWRLHDVVDAEGFSGPVRRVVLGAARTLPARILPVSEAAAAPVRAAGARDVLVLPNGVSLRPAADPGGARARIRRELGLAADAKVALMVGRLTPLKGAEVLFDALSHVAGVSAIVAGEATYSEVEGYGERLRERAAPLGGRVVFTGFRKDVPDLLAAADVLVHPSVKPDSLPTAILEALAAGVPVVASSAGGAAEILAGEAGGLLVPPRDPAALAAAMRRVLFDDALAESLRVRARDRARAFELAPACRAVWDAVLASARR